MHYLARVFSHDQLFPLHKPYLEHELPIVRKLATSFESAIKKFKDDERLYVKPFLLREAYSFWKIEPQEFSVAMEAFENDSVYLTSEMGAAIIFPSVENQKRSIEAQTKLVSLSEAVLSKLVNDHKKLVDSCIGYSKDLCKKRLGGKRSRNDDVCE
jgi:hypothetical protein